MLQNTPKRFVFRADDPCLDFLNTEIFSKTAGRIDLLNAYSDLLDWLVEAGLITKRDANNLRKQSATESAEAMARAIQFRTELRRSVERLAHGGSARNSTLQLLNQLLRENTPVEQLIVRQGRIEKRREMCFGRPFDVLRPIVEAAANLLASPRSTLIRHCEGPQCILFFLDTTKNHTRRWCSMEGCGNRVKVAAHRRRRR